MGEDSIARAEAAGCILQEMVAVDSNNLQDVVHCCNIVGEAQLGHGTVGAVDTLGSIADWVGVFGSIADLAGVFGTADYNLAGAFGTADYNVAGAFVAVGEGGQIQTVQTQKMCH